MLRRSCLLVAPFLLIASSGQARAQASGDAARAPVGASATNSNEAPKVRAPNGTSLTWLGHAAWLIRAPSGTTVLIDPWLENPRKPADFNLPETVDAIVVTHGHADHVGEAVALAEKLHAPVVGSFELIEALGLKDGIGANPGGTVTIKDIELHLTQAVHSSSVLPSRPLPPPPAANASQGAPTEDGAAPSDGCSCPDEHVCAEHHHHDHFVHGDAGKLVPGKSKEHKHGGAKHKRGNEAQELVVNEAPKNKMGPMESAVAKGQALAARGNAEAPQPSEDACHCGPPKRPMDHGHRPHLVYAGAAMGVIVKVANGPTIFHAGDTDVFLDMGLIKRRYEPEVALLPIGGHYTMGPKDAALAATLLGIKDVLPMHYGTSPLLSGTPKALRAALEDNVRLIAPRPGASVSYSERR